MNDELAICHTLAVQVKGFGFLLCWEPRKLTFLSTCLQQIMIFISVAS